ncbi:hypothetical protein [Maliponia aquimaris]|uniref:hypothetical protein n=1 Tax=Maliponia aquimaris TaxID=1673631 RepID=UPI000B8AFE6A|nr:hypothetical protein [Maliponia aquimaris]
MPALVDAEVQLRAAHTATESLDVDAMADWFRAPMSDLLRRNGGFLGLGAPNLEVMRHEKRSRENWRQIEMPNVRRQAGVDVPARIQRLSRRSL